MREPLVTVITPAGNRPERLQATLDSLAAQTLADWEHLVVGEAAEDGAPAPVAARAAQDPRIRYAARQGRCSGADVRNVGIKAARAPFVVLLEAGDVLAPECLARRGAMMSRNADLDFATFQPDDFANESGDARGFDPQLIGDDLCRFLYLDAPWLGAAQIWRRATLTRLGLVDETLPLWRDLELNVRAICAGCRYIRSPEGDHRIGRPLDPGQLGEPERLEGAADVIERLEAHVRAGPGMNWVRQRALCSLYYWVAERWVDRGDLGRALEAWRLIRVRRLGPARLYAMGAALLRLRAAGAPSGGLADAWRVWARLRALPALAMRAAPGASGSPTDRSADLADVAASGQAPSASRGRKGGHGASFGATR